MLPFSNFFSCGDNTMCVLQMLRLYRLSRLVAEYIFCRIDPDYAVTLRDVSQSQLIENTTKRTNK